MSIQSGVVVTCWTDLEEILKPEIHKRGKSKKSYEFCHLFAP